MRVKSPELVEQVTINVGEVQMIDVHAPAQGDLHKFVRVLHRHIPM